MIDTTFLSPEDRDALDLRTTEEIEDAADEQAESVREAVLGLPARPGVRR